MANYNNDRGDNRFGGAGGRPKYGGSNSRPSFGKRAFGSGRRNDKPMTLHKATCAECGKTCEVPFRPIAGKPVYCKECFDRKGGNTGNNRSGGRFPKRELSSHSFIKPNFENNRESNKGTDGVMKQLEAVNLKLDRLIQAIGALAPEKIRAQEVKEGLGEAALVTSKKISKKKTSKK